MVFVFVIVFVLVLVHFVPPETGGTRGEATEGVDSFNHAAGIFTCRPATINRGKATLTSDLSRLTAPQVH